MIEHLDRLPEVGDEITTEEGIRMVVEKLDKNRVELVHIFLPEVRQSADEDSEEAPADNENSGREENAH